MAHQHPLPPKKEVALALLERSSVHVHLDPRAKNVFVPQMFKDRAQLVLQVGLNLPVPIPDLRLDDQGMTCTLSFNRAPFYCVVPWSSVFAMVGDDGRGMVWPDDVPPEIAAQAQPRPQPQLAPAPEPKRNAGPVGVPNPKRVLAEVPPPGGKPKKKSRKKQRPGDGAEADRPVLVAVPAPEKKPKPEPAIAAKQAPAERPTDKSERHEKPEAPKPAPKPKRPGPPKAKRELPPYLRVVK